jgi:NADH-quinone oxidoreductase subunit M
MQMLPLILFMIIVPVIAFGVIVLLGGRHSRKILLASTLINLLITFSIFAAAALSGGINYSESYSYIPAIGINLAFRVNVISLVLLIMSSIVLFATALSGNTEKERPKLSSALIALFQVAAVGLFTSESLILLFIFWDIGVISLFFMINVLGSANRKSASINFLIYEILSSSLLLLGIILIYFYTPVHSFDIQYIMANAYLIPTGMQTIIFMIFFAAFMINMPIFPMHFWLPDAHTEAPTQGSMLLSGILTKFGAFGMLLLFLMLPVASKYSTYVAALAIFSIIYSAFLLIRQKDLKKIIAYSTIVEMGIILVGISASNTFGINGAAYAMLSHGLAISLMFLLVGIIKHMFGERNISVLKGTVINASAITYAFLFGVLAMIGFPLTAGFIADILLFIGSFQAFGLYGLIPLIGLVVMGSYLYFVISKSMLSEDEHSKNVDFATVWQKIGCAIFIFFIFLYGILPFTIIGLIKL